MPSTTFAKKVISLKIPTCFQFHFQKELYLRFHFPYYQVTLFCHLEQTEEQFVIKLLPAGASRQQNQPTPAAAQMVVV